MKCQFKYLLVPRRKAGELKSYHLNFLGRERKTDYLVSLPSQKDEAQGMVCQEAAKGRC